MMSFWVNYPFNTDEFHFINKCHCILNTNLQVTFFQGALKSFLLMLC